VEFDKNFTYDGPLKILYLPATNPREEKIDKPA
jgi:hypothetical protein